MQDDRAILDLIQYYTKHNGKLEGMGFYVKKNLLESKQSTIVQMNKFLTQLGATLTCLYHREDNVQLHFELFHDTGMKQLQIKLYSQKSQNSQT